MSNTPGFSHAKLPRRYVACPHCGLGLRQGWLHAEHIEWHPCDECLAKGREVVAAGVGRAVTDWYILEGHTPVKARDFVEGGLWMEAHTTERVVAQDVRGEVTVSTVFLGLDHNHGHDGPPILFETMIFGGEHDQYQTRCSTWAEAEQMHADALKLVTPPSTYAGAVARLKASLPDSPDPVFQPVS